MSPNRVVALLTPLVFAPLAGAVAAWLAKHFPALGMSKADVQEIFIGGALIALAPALQWLHGWQKHEARQADAEQALALAAPEDDESDDDESDDATADSGTLTLDELLALAEGGV